MTPKISIIIGIAVTALAFGVPTALAERQLVGPPEQERAARTSMPTSARRSRSRMTHRLNRCISNQAQGRLLRERGARRSRSRMTHRLNRVTHPRRPPFSTRTGARRSRHRDEAALAAAIRSGSIPTTCTGRPSGGVPARRSSGRSSESASSRILLIAGLWLAMRMTKGRPLAH